MNKIPPEIDTLIWAVAENADHGAIQDFENRYPEYRYELGKRIAMVRALRVSKPAAASPMIASHFRPTPQPARPTFGRWRWVPASIALTALAAAAFFGGMRYFSPKAVQKTSAATTVQNYPETNTTSGNSIDYRHDQQPPIVNSTPDKTVETPVTPPERRFAIKLEDIGLVEALNAIGMQTSADLQIAPGFPNPQVATLAYDGLTLEEILNDLGRHYGFTAMKQGPGEYLLIPAVDPNSDPGNNWNQGAGVNAKARGEGSEGQGVD